MAEKKPPTLINTKNNATSKYRIFTSKRPTKEIFGTKLLCVVLSINLENIRLIAGINRNTVTMLHTMLFASTKPISAPRRSDIVVSARRPAIVVSDELLISTIALARASFIASTELTSQFIFSSAKRCDSIIA